MADDGEVVLGAHGLGLYAVEVAGEVDEPLVVLRVAVRLPVSVSELFDNLIYPDAFTYYNFAPDEFRQAGHDGRDGPLDEGLRAVPVERVFAQVRIPLEEELVD